MSDPDRRGDRREGPVWKCPKCGHSRGFLAKVRGADRRVCGQCEHMDARRVAPRRTFDRDLPNALAELVRSIEKLQRSDAWVRSEVGRLGSETYEKGERGNRELETLLSRVAAIEEDLEQRPTEEDLRAVRHRLALDEDVAVPAAGSGEDF